MRHPVAFNLATIPAGYPCNLSFVICPSSALQFGATDDSHADSHDDSQDDSQDDSHADSYQGMASAMPLTAPVDSRLQALRCDVCSAGVSPLPRGAPIAP